MDYLLWTAFLLLQFLCLATSDSEVKLEMSMRYPYFDLTCEVTNTGDKRRTIYLFCPKTKGRLPCFQNCEVAVDLRDISCVEHTIGKKRKVVYTLNGENEIYKGAWTCGIGSKRSAPVKLNKPPPPPTTKPPPPPVKKSPPPPIIPPKIVPSTTPKPKPPKSGDIGWRGLDLTSPTLVIAVLVLLGLSLIVNIAFCIRCILVKKYIDKYRRGVTDTSCLESCLCIPKARVRGVFKDDLYEDISSTPRVVYSPGGSSKSALGADREDSLEFQSLARSRAYSPSSHRAQNPATRVGDIYATVVRDPRDPRRGSAGARFYSPQPPSSASRVYDDVPESRSLSEIPLYSRPQKSRGNGIVNVASSTHSSNNSSSVTGSSPRHSPDSTGTPSTIALKRVSEHPMEEEAEADDPSAGALIEACTRNDTRLQLSKTLLSRADTLLREAGTLLD